MRTGGNRLETGPSNSVTERLGFKPSDLESLAEQTLAGVNILADTLLENRLIRGHSK